MLAFGDSITYGDNASDRLATAYVPLLAAALGIGYSNVAVEGATMLGTIDRSSILTQMLLVQPPTRNVPCVMIVGTNDGGLYGSDAGQITSFQAGLLQGLLWLTSRRRVPEPKNGQERRLLALGLLPTIDDGCSVWVGDTPKQSAGHYAGLSSPAVQALYNAAISAAVATAAMQGRRVHLVDVASVYDPDTQGGDPPSNVHPADSGHLAIKNAFYTAMQAGGI